MYSPVGYGKGVRPAWLKDLRRPFFRIVGIARGHAWRSRTRRVKLVRPQPANRVIHQFIRLAFEIHLVEHPAKIVIRMAARLAQRQRVRHRPPQLVIVILG